MACLERAHILLVKTQRKAWCAAHRETQKREEERSRRPKNKAMATACFVSCVAGKGCCVNGNETTTSNGAVANQPGIRSLCKNSSPPDGVAKSLLLPGGSPEHRAEVGVDKEKQHTLNRTNEYTVLYGLTMLTVEAPTVVW